MELNQAWIRVRKYDGKLDISSLVAYEGNAKYEYRVGHKLGSFGNDLHHDFSHSSGKGDPIVTIGELTVFKEKIELLDKVIEIILWLDECGEPEDYIMKIIGDRVPEWDLDIKIN